MSRQRGSMVSLNTIKHQQRVPNLHYYTNPVPIPNHRSPAHHQQSCHAWRIPGSSTKKSDQKRSGERWWESPENAQRKPVQCQWDIFVFKASQFLFRVWKLLSLINEHLKFISLILQGEREREYTFTHTTPTKLVPKVIKTRFSSWVNSRIRQKGIYLR